MVIWIRIATRGYIINFILIYVFSLFSLILLNYRSGGETTDRLIKEMSRCHLFCSEGNAFHVVFEVDAEGEGENHAIFRFIEFYLFLYT